MKYYIVPNDTASTLFIVYHEQVVTFEKDYLALAVEEDNIREVLIKFFKIGRLPLLNRMNNVVIEFASGNEIAFHKVGGTIREFSANCIFSPSGILP